MSNQRSEPGATTDDAQARKRRRAAIAEGLSKSLADTVASSAASVDEARTQARRKLRSLVLKFSAEVEALEHESANAPPDLGERAVALRARLKARIVPDNAAEANEDIEDARALYARLGALCPVAAEPESSVEEAEASEVAQPSMERVAPAPAAPPAPPPPVPATPAPAAAAPPASEPPSPEPSPVAAAPAAGGPPPVIAAIASLFFPGLGQALSGQVAKGAALFFGGWCVGFLCGVVNLVAAYDAYKIGERRARGESVEPWQFM